MTRATTADKMMMDACIVSWWDNDAAVRSRLRLHGCMLLVVEGAGSKEVGLYNNPALLNFVLTGLTGPCLLFQAFSLEKRREETKTIT